MADRKLLVVFGATGSQGSSVVKNVLADPKAASQFKIRAVTRDTTKPAAKALEKQGCEVVSADLNDKSSIISALTGADAAFLVTDYWSIMDGEKEYQYGKTVADAAKELGLQHLIWSSLVNVSKVSKGKYVNVVHFDSKARVGEYIKSLGIPATFALAGYYMSNSTTAIRLTDPATNTYTLALPFPVDAKVIPMLDIAADYGKFVKGALLHRNEVLGKQVYAAWKFISMNELMADFRAALPKVSRESRAVEVTKEQYMQGVMSGGAPEFVALELYENMRLFPEFGYYGGAGLEESQKLFDEPLTTWREFVEKQEKWKHLH